jgi:hypothetical protein
MLRDFIEWRVPHSVKSRNTSPGEKAKDTCTMPARVFLKERCCGILGSGTPERKRRNILFNLSRFPLRASSLVLQAGGKDSFVCGSCYYLMAGVIVIGEMGKTNVELSSFS